MFAILSSPLLYPGLFLSVNSTVVPLKCTQRPRNISIAFICMYLLHVLTACTPKDTLEENERGALA